MTHHATTQHDAHQVIPEALAEYCEGVRQRRTLSAISRPLLAICGCPSVFESVITEHCKPKPGFNEMTATMDEIKDHFIERRIRERGTREKAADSLRISRSTINWREANPAY